MHQKEFDKRFDEECSKFSKKYNIQYEDVEDFAEWICWFSQQARRDDIIDFIKNKF